MFYLNLQSSIASRQPKILNLVFFANPVYWVRSHPTAWRLKTVQWHGWTRSSNNSIFLSEIYQFFVGKYSTFIYNPQALLESEKMLTLSVSLTLYTECEEIQEWHWENFSAESTGHGLRITKPVRQSDIFPYFSLKNTNFYWKYFIFI